MSEDNERRHLHVPGEPGDGPEHEPKQPHAGNGTVNDRLDDQGPDGLDSDEQTLRNLLHHAVQDIEPRQGTLDHLRRAVPARRARKRQAAVGMAAAALFIGTAVPALVHVSNSTGSDDNTTIAGHGQEAQGGSSEGKGPDGGSSTSGGSTGSTENHGKGGGEGEDKGPDASPGADPGLPANPTASAPASAPACTAVQLGAGTGTVDVPDTAGTVYGTFRISNISADSCTVTGAGTVTPIPVGAADSTKIAVTQHSSGDVAAALPDPSLEAARLVLLPGAAYEVRFAWVPSETCPIEGGNGGNGEPSTDPSPTEDPGATTGSSTGGDTGTSTQMLRGDGTADGSVQVSYTPEAGSAPVMAEVQDACAGTVYRTGVLAGQ
ncbi:hypothetical protein ACIQAC_10685 [Streptomyces sp. NPDC088387]|uniref:hypothetical protein n=1 Tax=Streptomyces sp. NPDC088387 TaxID=3365859 RepID=UPI003823C8E4